MRISRQRLGIFHADKHHPLLARDDGRYVFGAQRQGKILGVRRNHVANARDHRQAMFAGQCPAFRGKRALRGEYRPEATVQPALLHARQVHLGQVGVEAVPLGDVPIRTRQLHRSVEVAVEDGEALVKLRDGFPGVGESADQAQQHCTAARKRSEHACPPWQVSDVEMRVQLQ